MEIETKKEKILKLLLQGDKTTREIGEKIAEDSKKRILYNLFSEDLEQLKSKGLIKSFKKKNEDLKINTNPYPPLSYNLGWPNPPTLIKKKKLVENRPRKRGRQVSTTYSVFDIECIRRIYKEYKTLASNIQQNRGVLELIIRNHFFLPYIGIKRNKEEIFLDEYIRNSSIYIPIEDLTEIESDFIDKLKYSQQMFEICLNNEEDSLKNVFEEIYSLIDKTNMYGVKKNGFSINNYTEKGCLASDIVFEACLFVDMLKGKDCEEGIKYIEKKKGSIRMSKFKEIMQDEIERQNLSIPSQKLDFSKFNQTLKGK